MLININRKIFKFLNEELKQAYVYDIVQNENNDILDYTEEAEITSAIIKIINSNEEWHEKYGTLRDNGFIQADETCLVPAWSAPTGYYQLGKILVAPFDWSWDDSGDFDYSFSIFHSIEHCSVRT